MHINIQGNKHLGIFIYCLLGLHSHTNVPSVVSFMPTNILPPFFQWRSRLKVSRWRLATAVLIVCNGCATLFILYLSPIHYMKNISAGEMRRGGRNNSSKECWFYFHLLLRVANRTLPFFLHSFVN